MGAVESGSNIILHQPQETKPQVVRDFSKISTRGNNNELWRWQLVWRKDPNGKSKGETFSSARGASLAWSASGQNQ